MNYGLQQRSRWGLGDTPPGVPNQFTNQVIADQIAWRLNRTEELLQQGEIYFLSLSLGIASPAPAAGTQNIISTPNQDFDLLIIGVNCNRYLSSVQIYDTARNRNITNGNSLISSLASTPGANGAISERWNWPRPYLLPAKSQLQIAVTADGTETGGSITFYCLQPPVVQG